METGADRRTTTQLIVDVAQGASALVRDEIALARAEIEEKAAALREGALTLAVGGGLAFAGLLLLLRALTLALDLVLHAPWLSSAIVGILVAGTGAGLLLVGRRKLDLSPPSESR